MSIPCNQVDNIQHLKNGQDTIQKDINKIWVVLDGNGKPGLRTDIALMSQSIQEIKTKLSATSEINMELEIQRRVNIETGKIRNVKFSKVLKVIGLIFAFITLATSFVFSILSYSHTSEIPDLKSEVDMINIPVRTRSGVIEWYPAGIVIDSLNDESNNK